MWQVDCCGETVRWWDREIFDVLASLWQVPLDEVAEARQSVGCFEDAAL